MRKRRPAKSRPVVISEMTTREILPLFPDASGVDVRLIHLPDLMWTFTDGDIRGMESLVRLHPDAYVHCVCRDVTAWEEYYPAYGRGLYIDANKLPAQIADAQVMKAGTRLRSGGCFLCLWLDLSREAAMDIYHSTMHEMLPVSIQDVDGRTVYHLVNDPGNGEWRENIFRWRGPHE